jgi:hypothetical protein
VTISKTIPAVAGSAAIGLLLSSFAAAQGSDESERAGPVRDPLDPPSLRSTAWQVRSGEQVTSGTAFNPAISVILDGMYFTDNVHGESLEMLEEIDGFAGGHHHGDDNGHAHGAFQRGFNLREVEIAFSATVDPYFDAFAMLVWDSGEFELEEAYVSTRSLPAGLQVKLGRFLSDIGYINKQHPHSWYFFDRPLMNELLFGDHGLQENGVQLSWMPRTPFYTRFGIELLQGETSGVANYIGEVDDIAGEERGFGEEPGPRLYTSFVKVAPDLGFNHALQIGLFYGRSTTFQMEDEHSTRFEDWDGSVRFWGTDWVYKYDRGGQYGRGSFLLQGEYAVRKRDIDRQDMYFTCHPASLPCGDPGNQFQPGDLNNVQSFSQEQDGYYLQAVYGIAERWNMGLRHEVVGRKNFNGRGSGTSYDSSKRLALQTTWMPTEFSRLRLQLGRAELAIDGERERFNQVVLQWQMSLGVHGAHSF